MLQVLSTPELQVSQLGAVSELVVDNQAD